MHVCARWYYSIGKVLGNFCTTETTFFPVCNQQQCYSQYNLTVHLYLLTDSPVLLRDVQVLRSSYRIKQGHDHIQPVLAEIPPR